MEDKRPIISVNGKEIGRLTKEIKIKEFEGEIKIPKSKFVRVWMNGIFKKGIKLINKN